jgi:competence protein ComEA
MHAPSFTRRQALALAAAALAAVFLAAHVLGGGASTGGSPESQVDGGSAASIPALTTPDGAGDDAGSAAPASGSSGTAAVVVDVAGAVRRPGVYTLPQGSRITDAIARAGGATRRADEAAVDLAAPLADGEQVLVPGRGAAGVAAAGSSAGPSSSAPVDLNTATAEQLDALPGIGPVTAQKIIDYRQQHGAYRSVDDLDAIPGIGPAKIENLKGLVIA